MWVWEGVAWVVLNFFAKSEATEVVIKKHEKNVIIIYPRKYAGFDYLVSFFNPDRGPNKINKLYNICLDE